MLKNVLIIGGGSGIGEALNKLLQAKGANTYNVSRTISNTNVTDAEPNFPEIDGGIDALVYCPGSINLKPFGSLKIADFEADMNVNYYGAVKAIQKYLPNLKQGENPSILLFSTVAVQKGMPFHSSISGAKGAIEGLTKALAAEFAPSIRVNCIAPSLTETPLATKLLRNDKQREAAEARHPLKTIGEAKDIADMAAFLISDKAKWISGQILAVDGGMSTLATG